MRIKKQKQFFIFLFSFLNNGYSLKDGIKLYNEQFHSSFTRYIDNELSAGKNLHHTLKKINFNPYVVFIIKIGELSNSLREALTKAIEYIEFIENQRTHFINKLFYPLLSFFLISLLLLFVDIYLLPNLMLMTKSEFSTLKIILFCYKVLMISITCFFIIFLLIPKARYYIGYYKIYKTLNFSKVIVLLISAGYRLKGAIDELIHIDTVQWQAIELKKLLINNDLTSFYYLDVDFISLIKHGLKTNTILEAIKSYGDLKEKAFKLYLDIFYNGVVIFLYTVITVIVIVIYFTLIKTTSFYSF